MSGDGSSDNLLDLEFAYTTYQDSCRDLSFGSGRLRRQHEPNHPPHMLS